VGTRNCGKRKEAQLHLSAALTEVSEWYQRRMKVQKREWKTEK
jgi:hypothetical protein